MKVSFNGYGEQVATFEAGSNVMVGGPVAITGNGIVSGSVAGGDVCGICVSLENGYAAVQLRGYMRAEYTGTVTVGKVNLTGVVGGKVKVAAGAEVTVPVQVTDVDTVAKTCGFIL